MGKRKKKKERAAPKIRMQRAGDGSLIPDDQEEEGCTPNHRIARGIIASRDCWPRGKSYERRRLGKEDRDERSFSGMTVKHEAKQERAKWRKKKRHSLSACQTIMSEERGSRRARELLHSNSIDYVRFPHFFSFFGC